MSSSLPSSSHRTRSAMSRRRGSWETTTTALPCFRARSRRSSMTSCPWRESRFAVGSSARSRGGWLASARAIDTRCFSPPERSRAWKSRRPSSPASTSRSRARRAALEPVTPATFSATSTFSRAVSDSSRLKVWNTKPTSWRRMRGSSSAGSAATSRPSISTRPEVDRSSAPIIVRSVVFPEPDGPMIRVISPDPVSKLTPSTARTSVRPDPKTFVKLSTSSSGVALMP